MARKGGDRLKAMLWVTALQFGIHALLLAGTAQLAGCFLSPLRLLLASCLGAAYGAICLQPGARMLAAWPWHLLSLGAVGLVAYGRDGKAVGAFVLLTMALDGAVLAAGRGNLWQLPLYALGVQLMGKLAFGTRRQIISISILGEDASVTVGALRDTGNELRDPVTGGSVLVVDALIARELTGLSQYQLEHPLETIAAAPLPGLRLIPYQSVGEGSGMMVGKKFTIRMGGRSRRGLVAFAPQHFGQEYQALTGGSAYEEKASHMATGKTAALLHRRQ